MDETRKSEGPPREQDSSTQGDATSPVGVPMSAIFESPEAMRGRTIGRYVILERLGSGGMGVVYAAFDPELNRKIAIKVLRTVRVYLDEGANARMMREAQALARLAHPNVVNVHDVGEFKRRIFIAMEFIDGVTITQWLQDKSRRQAEILALFRQAGEGLAAAHDAGLVHRDFKPDNVLVGADGRARVVDFGLARGAIDEWSDEPPSGIETVSHFDAELTREGTVMGTPGYMAPEQLAGADVDAATDQFAFCVALYLALYGHRPFRGRDADQISAAVRRGKIRDAPANTRVPTWLREVIVRGLNPKPASRHPSMRALLSALSDDPVARRRRYKLGAGATLAGGLAIAAAYRAGADNDLRPCARADAPIDQTWTAARAARIESAFSATARPYATQTWQRAARSLQGYVDTWRATAVDACRATHVTHTQSAELLDRRAACLEARRQGLDALLEVLERADDAAVERAGHAIESLPPVAPCADPALAQRAVTSTASASQLALRDAWEVDLMRLDAQTSVKGTAPHLAEYEALLERAAASGDDVTIARATYALADARGRAGHDGTIDAVHHALTLAIEAGSDRTASQAAADLAQRYGVTREDSERGKQWSGVARALAARAGGDTEIDLICTNVEAVVAVREGRFSDARALFESVVNDPRERLSDGARATALRNLGTLFVRQGDLAQARTAYDRAAALLTEVRGPGHPDSLGLRTARAHVELTGKDYAAARAELGDALQRQREALAEGHPDIILTLALLAVAERHLGNGAQAEALHREALSRRRELHGPEHPLVAESLRHLALVLADRGAFDDALATAERAQAMGQRVLPANHPDRALADAAVGRYRTALGRHAEAIAPLRAAVARLTDDPHRVAVRLEAQTTLASALHGNGQHDEAMKLWEAVLGAPVDDEDIALQVARAAVALGATLADAEPSRVRALADRALGLTKRADIEHQAVADQATRLKARTSP